MGSNGQLGGADLDAPRALACGVCVESSAARDGEGRRRRKDPCAGTGEREDEGLTRESCRES